MSWASRRRIIYATGVILFFLIVIGGPLLYSYLKKPPTCTDGIRNQGETSVDKGGPCPLLDTGSLSPSAVLWTRSFYVRSGSYDAVAYIQNPNQDAGARAVPYRFGLYDEHNVLIAERTGMTFLMPGGITPVFEGAIDTGNRVVSHTYFDFTEPVIWERMADTSGAISVSNTQISDVTTSPRVTANVLNTSVAGIQSMAFVVIISDPAGNAFAASQTALTELAAGESRQVIFTWPSPFNITVGKVQIVPLTAPRPVKGM